MRRRAFTLIESLGVVAIDTVLIGLLHQGKTRIVSGQRCTQRPAGTERNRP